ncbi:hypothetical protein GCM10007049_28960 [Echinicola pacifica]|uniref:Outer membrane protein beta-barrel domain-containing protein n=1 Tax=Echinicola pacifica TaxID=346377 RepID=A0A918Q6U1_9BACT|nr:outer membrane beta-barrel protein [Echinicola pacifica]GGZ33855.1 hypothetical protein GCM10007049_28960 [Echinicola pacifica]
MRARIIYLLLLLVIAVDAFGQKEEQRLYKPFKVDVGINLTFPTDSKLTTGGGFLIEPRYGLNDHFHIGVQLASNILGEGESIFNHQEATYRAQAISNASLTGEYQFGLENTRPFIGLMAGMYRRSDYEIVDAGDGTIINRQAHDLDFGLAPRIGVISGKFRMNVTYHITGTEISDFFSLGFGIQFGGGKIKDKDKDRFPSWE